MIGLWTSQFVQGNLDGGHQTVSRALTLVEPESELSGPAHFAAGGTSVSLGMPAEAVRHFDLAAVLTRGAPSLSVGTRPDVHAGAWAAHAHWLLGDDEKALLCSRSAIELARTIDHPYSLAVALAYAGVLHQMRRDMPELTNTVAELRGMCDRYEFAYYREWGVILDGWSRQDESGIELAHQGIEHLKSDGSFARMPYWLSLLADLLGGLGKPDAAQAILDAAVVAGQARRDVWWMPEVLRMRATYDDREAAVSRLRAAADMAHAQGSVALLRRCQHDLVERGVPASR